MFRNDYMRYICFIYRNSVLKSYFKGKKHSFTINDPKHYL